MALRPHPRSFAIPGPAGRLAAVLEPPAGEPEAAAIVCHPHPLGGGTMRNTIVHRVARALREAGLLTLRFDFRGAGESEGEFDGRGGEELDALAALDWLERQRPGLELWGAGFSFGARTVASLALSEPRLVRLVLVALPQRELPVPPLEALRQPTLFLFAGADPYGNLSDFQARIPDPPAHFETVEIAGADHFFRGRTPELEEQVRQHAHRVLGRTT